MEGARSEVSPQGEDFLSVYLEPFLEQLCAGDVTDIYVNRPGELWVETLGGSLSRQDAPELTPALLWRLARQIASTTHQGVSRAEPLLAARLPDGSRVQIVAPPATREWLALAIRRHVSADLSLDDYETAGAFADTGRGDTRSERDEKLDRLYDTRDWRAFLSEAVMARQTILISGGTSTGKTTLLNALLREIPERERLIMIEDTPELALRHPNAAGLVTVRGEMGESKVSADDLLIASLRMRPDRIILGELRGDEAATFLRAINTGHPGSLTTIHANSPTQAIEQLVLLASSRTSMSRQDIIAYVHSTVDIIVQLKNESGRRSVASIYRTREG